MSKEGVSQFELIDRYVRSQLDDDELEQFEIALLEDAELLEEVKHSEALHTGLKAEMNRLQARSKEPLLVYFTRWFSQPLSVTASVLVAVLALLPFLQSGGNLQVAGNQALNVNSTIHLEQLRGNDSGFGGNGEPPILLTIDVGPRAETDFFSVFITDTQTSEDVLRVENAHVDNEGWLRIVVNEALSGEYTLTVNDLSSDMDVSYQLLFD